MTFRAKRLFQYVAVHLFQAMYFYEGDFEYYRPAKAVISGLTHTNRYGMVSNDVAKAGTLTFMSPVSYVMDWTTGDPYRATTWSGYSSGSNQRPTFQAEITQTPRLEPMGTEPREVLDAAPKSPLSPSGQLVGPDGDSDGNPNNDSFHEIIEPPALGFADPEAIASRRIYNKAGILVTINGASKTVVTQNGTSLSAAQVTALQSAISTTTIYDQRERSSVRVSSLDVGAAKPVLDAASDFNGVIYIHDITPTVSATPKNAIRLKNGGKLPEDGLTVASQNAIYIQGDYNTGATSASGATAVPSNSSGNPNNTATPTVAGYTRKPAAVIGDAVMLLSNAWSDGNSSLSIGQRMASNTTYNTALISGVMPSGYEPGGAAAQYGYSGGANNYPRFLENWNARTCTYFGLSARWCSCSRAQISRAGGIQATSTTRQHAAGTSTRTSPRTRLLDQSTRFMSRVVVGAATSIDMKRLIRILTLALATPSIAGDINLVPEFRTFREEGGEIRRLKFAGANEDHHLTLDEDVGIQKLQNGARFTFQKVPRAIFEIQPGTVGKDRPISPENRPTYYKAAIEALPPNASDVKLIEEVPSPHPINAWKSHRFVFSYLQSGESYRVAVTFITLSEGPQIMLTTSAPSEDYENGISRSDSLLRSWYTVRQGEGPGQAN